MLCFNIKEDNMISKKWLLLIFVCILTFFVVPNMVIAEAGGDQAKPTAVNPPVAAVPPPASGGGNGTNPQDNSIKGLNLGIGLSITIDLGQRDRVKDASVVNGIVRVSEDNNVLPRVLLETHYFFLLGDSTLPAKIGFGGLKYGDCGIGPFVAIQTGTDNIIQAYGLGVMIGFKKKSTDQNSTSSFNFGIGGIWDPHVQVLGDGLEKNKPLPAGETEVRFKETGQFGLMLMTSFSF
jgi:hypothetical protein